MQFILILYDFELGLASGQGLFGFGLVSAFDPTHHLPIFFSSHMVAKSLLLEHIKDHIFQPKKLVGLSESFSGSSPMETQW